MNLIESHKEALTSAIKLFARPVDNKIGITLDMAPLVAATSRLPSQNPAAWEQLIRAELSIALHASISSGWKLRARPDRLLAWVDICNYDGFKRENVLRAAAGAAPNGFFFALALRRLNDWVPEVRKAARETLPSIAMSSDAGHVVDALCITFPYWNSWRRMDGADKDVLTRIVSIDAVAQTLKSRIISSTAGPMTSILAQAARTDALDRYLDEISRNATEPSVRAKAFRFRLEGRAIWIESRKWEWTDTQYNKGRTNTILAERPLSIQSPLLETLNQAAADKSPAVRWVAAEILLRNLDSIGPESRMLAELLAADSAPAIAERGRFMLDKLNMPAT